MMEQVNAVGISVIQFLQECFAESEWYFALVNQATNPHYAFHMLLPAVAAVDSVFAAQFLLCTGFGVWLNAVMKWWLLEDRPYWWVQESSFYTPRSRPTLAQFPDTCETGPGCPSGHSNMVSMELLLLLMWISHVMHDRKCYFWWWKVIAYPVCAVILLSTMMARMFVAAHFPHQCLLGAVMGLFIAPAVCIYVCDPFIWDSEKNEQKTQTTVFYHTIIAVMLIVISFITYWTLKVCGIDPQWSVRLAFRWCQDPVSIRVTSTPLFALVQSTASLLGWALSVTPTIDKYRHNTTQRSLIIAAFATYLALTATQNLHSLVPKNNAKLFYPLQFLIYAAKVPLYLRVVPWLAMWPYGRDGRASESGFGSYKVKMN